MSKEPTLIAVDPSLTATGIVIFQGARILDHVVIKTTPRRTHTERLAFIGASLSAFLADYPSRLMAIETQYISMRTQSALKVVEVRGLIEGLFLENCRRSSLPPLILEVAPSSARKHLGIKGRLKRKEGKIAIKLAVQKLYPDLEASQDVYDAVGVGIAGYAQYREQLKNIG